MYPCILVALDGSQASLEGLREAIRLAQGHPTRLILLHLIDDFPTLREIASNRSMAQLEAERRDSAQTLLEQGVQLAHASQVEAGTEVRIAVETLADSIVDAAKQAGCGLIVLGMRRSHAVLRSAMLGSTVAAVLQRSPVPVLVVPAGAPSAAA